MRIHRNSAHGESRSRRPTAAKARAKQTAPARNTGDRDPFLEVQAESGRRMRPVVAEHYGEIE
jgi:hypothetical protein